MIKINKSAAHFILKAIIVITAACIGLYTGFAKSKLDLNITDSSVFLNFSSTIKTLVCDKHVTKDFKNNT